MSKNQIKLFSRLNTLLMESPVCLVKRSAYERALTKYAELEAIHFDVFVLDSYED